MKAELSHFGYTGDQTFTGVYLQQGSMITDRDWNALVDRLKAQINAFGQKAADTGIPKKDGLLTGFKSAGPSKPWTARFRKEGGCVVAVGVLGCAFPIKPSAAFSYGNQKSLPRPPKPPANAVYYADIWDEVKTAYDNPDLLDVGLNGAHTAFVTERHVQIKTCDQAHVSAGKDGCGTYPNPENLPEIGTGTFEVALRTTAESDDKCDPCAEFVDVERVSGNYLFRIEVHNVSYDETGVAETITLKWSSENGAIELPIPGSLNDLDLSYVYEFYSPLTELNMGLPAGGFGDAPNRGVLVHKPTSKPDGLERLRRWDGFAEIDLRSKKLGDENWDRGVQMSTGLGNESHGHVGFSGSKIQLNLSDIIVTMTFPKSQALTGDFWLALARSNAKDKDRIRALSPTSLGIRHHYCVLGLSEDGQEFHEISPQDKRRLQFPDLTCLHAGDVSYDPHACEHASQATNVQEALDAICAAIPEYHVLKMSAGTGQDGELNKIFLSPLEVLVEDQDGRPVGGVEVIFSADHPLQSEKPIDHLHEPIKPGNGKGPGKAKIRLKTNEFGYAHVYWTPRTIEGHRSVRVELANPPQGRAGVLWYTGAAFKKRATDLPVIKEINWLSGKPYTNDHIVSGDQFGKGLEVHCSHEIMPDYISPDMIRMTCEVLVNENTAALQSFIICCKIEVKENRIVIFPDGKLLFDLLESNPITPCTPDGIRIRLEILGRFVFSAKGQMLDAFIPGKPDERSKKVLLHPEERGLGHPSDLMAWFYLEPHKEVPPEKPTVFVNRDSNDKMVSTDVFSNAEAKFIRDEQPHWKNMSMLVKALGITDRARLKELKERVSFAGFKPREAPPEEPTVFVNRDKEGTMIATEVFSNNETPMIVENQPHWKDMSMLVKALGITDRARLKELKERVSFAGFKPREEPPEEPTVFVNRDKEATMIATGVFSNNETPTIVGNQPHWEDLGALANALQIRDRARFAQLQRRVSFAGFKPKDTPPRDADIFVNRDSNDKMVSTRVFSNNEAGAIRRNQPHWKNIEALAESLRISDRTRLAQLKTRVSFAGFEPAGRERVDVVLISTGRSKIKVIKEIRDQMGLGLGEAKRFVEQLPAVVKSNVTEAEAKSVKKRLEEVGAKVELR